MELIDLINKKEISDSSKKVYQSLLKRLMNSKFKIPLKSNEQINKIEAFLETFDNPNTKLDFLNLIIVIRNVKELPVDKLKLLRIKLKQLQKTHQVSKLNGVGDSLISYESFNEKLNKAFEDAQYKKYIVNYLSVDCNCTKFVCEHLSIAKIAEDRRTGPPEFRSNYKIILLDFVPSQRGYNVVSTWIIHRVPAIYFIRECDRGKLCHA